ncbi:hypothetical protein AB0D04_33350 [Streptomyces sp. NPDC048483]|uniref:hypothetical protein n=1 Tax=Streptomyces sp. NPDC048483 TaxID=3154927 RepID=UPI0034270518
MSEPQPPIGRRPVPAHADEALEIGRNHFPSVWPDGERPTLHVHEFDIGYLVYPVFPPRAPDAGPRDPGGSHIAISKADGHVSALPNYSPEEAVEWYRRRFRQGT